MSTPATKAPNALTIQFLDFHANNPDFYDTLVARTHQYLAAIGGSKTGIKAIFEQARWDHTVTTNNPNFKVNNNYAPFYARLIMLQEPALEGVFKLRRAREAQAWIDSLVGAP